MPVDLPNAQSFTFTGGSYVAGPRTYGTVNFNQLFNWKDYVNTRFERGYRMKVARAGERIHKHIYEFVLARANYWAGQMLREFIEKQRIHHTGSRGKFWTNRTHLAAMSWFTGAMVEGTEVIMFAAHGNEVPYAKYLEYAMGRRFESLRPMINKYGQRLIDDLRKRLSGAWESGR